MSYLLSDLLTFWFIWIPAIMNISMDRLYTSESHVYRPHAETVKANIID